MPGLSFIQTGFLFAGLAAAAAPIIIHLLFRQRARKLYIGSVRFLKSVVREHHRRRRVRQWILLALRMIALMLIAALFARPYMDESYRDSLQQILVVLIDSSASMRVKDSRGVDATTDAIKEARKQLADVNENAVVHVAWFDATGIHEATSKEFDKAPPRGLAATDYGLAIGWARDVLMLSNRTNRRVVMITDLQRTGLERTATDVLPDGTKFQLIDVGQAIRQNVAIQSAEAIRSEIRPKEPITLRANIANFGSMPIARLPLHVSLTSPGGKIEFDKNVSLGPSTSSSIDLELPITEDGIYQGTLSIQTKDDADWDNVRYVALEARHPDRLLLIDGEEGRSVYTNETYYLETALRLRTAESATHMRSFEVERLVWDTGEGFPNLAGFRGIIVANARRFTSTDIERLKTYLQQGGSVLIFAGDLVNPDHLDAMNAAKIFPGVVQRQAVSRKTAITDWAKEHPALRKFRDPQYGDLHRISLNKYLPLKTLANGATPLLTADKSIVAAEMAVGAGRCIYVGTTADRAWTDWPQSRLYVPVVRQLAAYLTNQLRERSPIVHEVISKPGDKVGVSALEGRFFVHNADPRESILDRMTEEDFRAVLRIPDTKLTADELARYAALKLPENAQRADEIWTWVLWALFAILVGELFLASRVHA